MTFSVFVIERLWKLTKLQVGHKPTWPWSPLPQKNLKTEKEKHLHTTRGKFKTFTAIRPYRQQKHVIEVMDRLRNKFGFRKSRVRRPWTMISRGGRISWRGSPLYQSQVSSLSCFPREFCSICGNCLVWPNTILLIFILALNYNQDTNPEFWIVGLRRSLPSVIHGLSPLHTAAQRKTAQVNFENTSRKSSQVFIMFTFKTENLTEKQPIFKMLKPITFILSQNRFSHVRQTRNTCVWERPGVGDLTSLHCLLLLFESC